MPTAHSDTATAQPLRIVMIVMDRDGTATFLRSDRKEATVRLDSNPFEESSALARTVYLPGEPIFFLETTQGDRILAELPTLEGMSPRGGRPVIYLDQKDWSTLSKALYEPQRLPSDDRDAAEVLIRLALDRRVILPMSSAHMSETCKWTDDVPRYQLALTLARLSAGWQMRDPLDVRRFELRQAFSTRFHRYCLLPPDIFTLAPYAITGVARGGTPPREPPKEFPPDMALATAALTSVVSYFDTMLDTEAVGMTPADAWVSKNQGFFEWLRGEERSSQQKRQSTDVFFIADTQKEIAEEAARTRISPEQMSTWIRQYSRDDVASMPSLGLFREALHGKHMNGSAAWTDNDLIDLMYLTCAAGYADYTVGERSLISQLEQGAKRLGRDVKVYRRLSDLLDALEEDGLCPESARSPETRSVSGGRYSAT